MLEMPKSSKEINNTNKKPFKDYFKWFLKSFIWLAILLFVLDIITKFVAFYNLPKNESLKINGFEWLFQLTLTFNTGAAWGMGGNNLVSRIILCFISYAAAGFIIYYYIKNFKKLTSFLKAILMVVLAGDLGNLIDRTFSFFPLDTIYKNGVVDFIDITPLIPRFGIFNFADSCLCVGIFLLLIYEIILIIKDKNKKEENKEADNK